MVSLLLLPSACQKKDAQINEVKNQNTEEKKVETTANSRFVTDPYQVAWDTADNQAIARFYLDINQDEIPELFLSNQINSCISVYKIYQIKKEGYLFVSDINTLDLRVLQTSHFGFCDLLCSGHYKPSNDQLEMDIDYFYLEYNGEKYSLKKQFYTLDEVKQSDLKIDTTSVEYKIDYHQRNDDKIWDTLKWSPEDDQTYRDYLQLEETKIVDRNIADPYKKTWDKLGGAIGAAPYNMSRFNLDINQDSIPELFLSQSSGTGGVCYEVYQILKKGYWYVSTIDMAQGVKVLPEMNHNFCYLIVSSRGGDQEHAYSILEYNGEEYKSVSGATFKTPKERYEADIFKRAISSDYKIEYIHNIPEENRQEVPWSPKDDDQYRN